MKNLFALLAVVGFVAGGILYGMTRSADVPGTASGAEPAVSCCSAGAETTASPNDGDGNSGCCASEPAGGPEHDDCTSCS